MKKLSQIVLILSLFVSVLSVAPARAQETSVPGWDTQSNNQSDLPLPRHLPRWLKEAIQRLHRLHPEFTRREILRYINRHMTSTWPPRP